MDEKNDEYKREELTKEQLRLINKMTLIWNSLNEINLEKSIVKGKVDELLENIILVQELFSDCECHWWWMLEYKEKHDTKILSFETEIKELEKKNLFLSNTNNKLLDQLNYCWLTNIFNRYAFNNKFERLVNDFNLSWKKFSFALIDLDKFKNINDTYWHDHWDRILKVFSTLLLKEFSMINVEVYRIGWEEFWLLGDEKVSIEIIYNSLYKVLKYLNGKVITVNNSSLKHQFTFSAWLAWFTKTWKHELVNYWDFYNYVDKLMYSVKDESRNWIKYEEL